MAQQKATDAGDAEGASPQAELLDALIASVHRTNVHFDPQKMHLKASSRAGCSEEKESRRKANIIKGEWKVLLSRKSKLQSALAFAEAAAAGKPTGAHSGAGVRLAPVS